MSLPAAVYRPRNPQDSDYYRCVEDYFETFVQIYDEHFSRQYGFWRPYVEQVIYRYLDCGIVLTQDIIFDYLTTGKKSPVLKLNYDGLVKSRHTRESGYPVPWEHLEKTGFPPARE